MSYAGGQPVNELVVIVEGETEQTFVRDQLAAHLVMSNTTAWPILPGVPVRTVNMCVPRLRKAAEVANNKQ